MDERGYHDNPPQVAQDAILPPGGLGRRRYRELSSAGAPALPFRELLLTLNAPFRPLSAGAVYHVVVSRLGALDIPSLHAGPHGLRHACATHLVAQGLSFPLLHLSRLKASLE